MSKYRITYSAVLLMASMLLFSCSDVLNKAPDGTISPDDVFSSNERTGAFLERIYGEMPTKGMHYYYFTRMASWCDEAWDGDYNDVPHGISARLYIGDASAEDFPVWTASDQISDKPYNNADQWNRYWMAIHDCSWFIKAVEIDEDDPANPERGYAVVSNETNRKRWAAEAHLLRAYYYAELLRWFGTGLPLISEAIDFHDFDDSEKVPDAPKATYKETVDFIIADCRKAIECDELPDRIVNGLGEQHRVPKALAYALISRCSLYMASPLYCDGQDYWKEAYENCYEAMNWLRDAGFKLYSSMQRPEMYDNNTTRSYFGVYKRGDNGEINTTYPLSYYSGVYNEYFCEYRDRQGAIWVDNPVDNETIYQLVHKQGSFNMDAIGCLMPYKSGTNPSQEMVDCFEYVVDGKAYPILDLKKPYLDPVTHLQPNYNQEALDAGFDPNNPYANRDPRFYADIYYNGALRYCWWPFAERADSPDNFFFTKADSVTYSLSKAGGIRTRVVATWEGEKWTGTAQTGRTFTRTGYFIRKYLNPRASSDTGGEYASYKDFRYAEILLNFAEAALHMGRETEARNAINEVRTRVGMPPISEMVSGEELMLRYINERRVEFAFEEQRFFDVRRWHKPDEDLEETDRWITKMSITPITEEIMVDALDSDENPILNPDGTVKQERFIKVVGYKHERKPAVYERQNWQNKYLKLPIPLDEINRIRTRTGENWQNPGW